MSHASVYGNAGHCICQLYATYRCCEWAQLRCRPSPYNDAVCVNAAAEINMLDYNVAVHCRVSTYSEFGTWYGLRQIRGMLTLHCLHKPCIQPCGSSIKGWKTCFNSHPLPPVICLYPGMHVPHTACQRSMAEHM